MSRRVHRVVDPDLAREVERVRPGDGESPAEFRRWARRRALLQHPAIPAVLRLRDDPGLPELTRDPTRGAPLSADPPAGLDARVRVLATVAAALASAHGSGCTHGALDAECVRLGAHGQTQVCGWQLPDDADPGADHLAFARLCHAILGDGAATVLGDAPAELDALRHRLAAWTRREHTRREALERVAEADAVQVELRDTRVAIVGAVRTLHAALRSTRPWTPVPDKQPLWRAEDRLAELVDRRDQLEERWLALLATARGLEPDLREAHTRLARFHREEHERASRRRHRAAARYHEERVRYFDRGEQARWLDGRGSFELHTTTPARAVLFRFDLVDRALRPVEVADLGSTPVHARDLPAGSYLVELTAHGRRTVRVPVRVERDAHHADVPPGGTEPVRHPLPPEHALGLDDILVPAGWCEVGDRGDPEDAEPHRRFPAFLPRQLVWVDAFVVRRDPVTQGAYRDWLNALCERGRRDLAERYQPRAASGAPVMGQEGGRFFLQPGYPDAFPMGFLSPAAADAWCAELAGRTGRPWRAPSELEWEKAARGVDGRQFPWGDAWEPAFTRTRDGQDVSDTYATPCAVGEPSTDTSVYGVRGMFGSFMEVCLERSELGPEIRDGRLVLPTAVPGPRTVRALRGCAYYMSRSAAFDLAFRNQWAEHGAAASQVSVRPFRSITEEEVAAWRSSRVAGLTPVPGPSRRR